MFIVRATWCQLDNHQASSVTQGSNHVCRPPKSTVLTDQFQTVTVILNFDWCQKFNVFLANQNEAGLTSTLVCSNPKWYTKFSCLPCLFWTFLYNRLALCMMMSSSPIHFMSPHSLNLLNTLAWNYNFNNKKTWNILVLEVIWYHHALACTLNSVVFKLCLWLLFLKSIMVTLYLYWTFCLIKPPGQIENLTGLKIISNVNVILVQSTTQHMIHWNIACVLILLYTYLFSLNSSICNPISTYLD